MTKAFSGFALCLMAVMLISTVSTAQSLHPLVVDFSKPAGKIRAIHGVNGGPSIWGANDDITQYHADAEFPSTRLHDAHWPSPDVVDVPAIFPIFDADPDDPKNYLFTKTDAYLAPIVKNGSRINYRLGISIEVRLRNVVEGGWENHPPKDYAKWARICVNIIRHYNDGWANGFHYGLKYFEVWNEPEGKGTWSGTEQQYLDLYEVTAKALKAYDPSLKVGGPVMGGPLFDNVRTFLSFCRDRQIPLDFFSWHYYGGTPQDFARYATGARAILDEYGFVNTESHLTEWHWVAPPSFGPDAIDIDQLSRVGAPDAKKTAKIRQFFDDMRGPSGCSMTVSTLLLFQDTSLDMANFYEAGTNPWSMFDEWGIPGTVYYGFLAFNRLTKTPNRVACDHDTAARPNITACAGLSEDNKKANILLSNFSPDPALLSLSLRKLPMAQPLRAETFAVDATHEFTRTAETTLQPEESVLPVELPPYGVSLISVTGN